MKILLITLISIITIYFSYFIIMCIGLLKKKSNNNIKSKKHKFAILIAARNEEKVILNLIKSLNKQKYPNALYKTYVILNNCTDNTKEEVLKTNANILEVNNISSKGEALKYAYNYLSNDNSIDAYIIFDADNIVDNNFLNSMNESLNNGYNVVQGFRKTKNINDNWLSSSYAIMYYIQGLFINKARFNLGKSAFLNGTGFMVKKSVIDKHGFNPKTITEDIEFTMMCAINNEKIAYNENALFYDEQVVNLKDSIKQRKRWSFGTIKCLRYYFKPLVINIFKNKSLICLDVIMFYLTVFMQIVIFITFIVSLLFMIINTPNITSIYYSLLISLSILLLGIIFRTYLIKHYGNSIIENIGGILIFDLFLLSWLPINIACLFKKNCSWDQIKHSRVVEIDNT